MEESANPKKQIYFIFQEGDENRCKIGKSKDVNDRVKQLQTGNPDKLYVYRTVEGYTSEENEIHKMLNHLRIDKSEWFYLNKQQLDHILDYHYLSYKERRKNIRYDVIVDKAVQRMIKEMPSNDESYEKTIISLIEDDDLSQEEILSLCFVLSEMKSLLIKQFTKHKTDMTTDDRKKFHAEMQMFTSKLGKISKTDSIKEKIDNWKFT